MDLGKPFESLMIDAEKLENDVIAAERPIFNKKGAAKPTDQLLLDLDRHQLGLVLQTVARANFVDRDALRQSGRGQWDL